MFQRLIASVRESSMVRGELVKVSFSTKMETIGATTVVISVPNLASLYLVDDGFRAGPADARLFSCVVHIGQVRHHGPDDNDADVQLRVR